MKKIIIKLKIIKISEEIRAQTGEIDKNDGQ